MIEVFCFIDDLVNLLVPYFTTILTFIATKIAWTNYRLTKNFNIAVSFPILSSWNSAHCISELLIENRKNIPCIILGIFVKINHNYTIELKDFETEPMILKPLEAIHVKLERVSFYTIGNKIVEVDNLFDYRSNKIEIIFRTTKGWIKAKSKIFSLPAEVKMLKNKYYANITPVRMKYDDKIVMKHDFVYIIEVYKDDKKYPIFIDSEGYVHHLCCKIELIPEVIKKHSYINVNSKEDLVAFIEKGGINCDKIEIKDVVIDDFYKGIYILPKCSFVKFIFGYILTYLENKTEYNFGRRG
jgi:hypothetical protein